MTNSYDDSPEGFLKYALNNEIGQRTNQLEKWKKGFEEDPFYAFSWSDDLFTAAARLDLAKLVLRIIETSPDPIQKTINRLTVECKDRAMRYALYGHHSTSATTNRAEEAKASAAAEMLRTFDSYHRAVIRKDVETETVFKWWSSEEANSLEAFRLYFEETGDYYLVQRKAKGSKRWRLSFRDDDEEFESFGEHWSVDDAKKEAEQKYVNAKVNNRIADRIAA